MNRAFFYGIYKNETNSKDLPYVYYKQYTKERMIMRIEYWIIGSVLVLYYIVMTFVQYRNIAATKKEFKKSGQTHNERYEDMSFEEQEMQFNLQGSPVNLPATLVAQLIYFLRHGREGK